MYKLNWLEFVGTEIIEWSQKFPFKPQHAGKHSRQQISFNILSNKLTNNDQITEITESTKLNYRELQLWKVYKSIQYANFIIFYYLFIKLLKFLFNMFGQFFENPEWNSKSLCCPECARNIDHQGLLQIVFVLLPIKSLISNLQNFQAFVL